MNRDSWIIVCWSYLLGLLTTGIFYFDYIQLSSWSKITFILILILVITVVVLVLNKIKYFYFKTSWSILAVGVFLLAPIYFQFRVPQPQVNDISQEITKSENIGLVIIQGKVLSEPRITANGKLKFWFKVNQLRKLEETSITESIKKVSGKLYVTAPLLEANNVDPQASLAIKGLIYQPKSPQNPGQFDFKKYLENQGSFAGFKGLKIIQETTDQKPPWGWWKVRRRIIRAQVRGLGSPTGQLVSSIVLGRRAVDLPQDIRDLFIKTGLAHILAASGFHVSLLLGMVLRLTNSLSSKLKLWIGLECLFLYSCLTGFSPSVIRAVLMGTGVLVALSVGGKVKPLGSLFLSLIIILLVNPLWIWNLGLQLSFLATLGLIVSVPTLEKKLEWMPPLLATAIAVPLAASIWTLPLIIFTFNTISSYSIIVNVISMPLVTIVSLGGMISSVISLIFPSLGSICAAVLYYPSWLLIKLTQFFAHLPGNVLFVGKISLLSVIIIYGLICLSWLNKQIQKKWQLVFLLSIAIVIIPNIYQGLNLFKITILKANSEPIVVIQDKGEVILLNSGSNLNNAKYTIMPFLISQGINKIDYGIALDLEANSKEVWSYIQDKITVKDLITSNQQFLSTDKILKTNSTGISLVSQLTTNNQLSDTVPIISLKTNQYNWLIANNLDQSSLNQIKSYIESHNLTAVPLVLLWSGNQLESRWLESFNLEFTIAINSEFQGKTNTTSSPGINAIHIINEDGAISWSPKIGFQGKYSTTEVAENYL